VIYDRRQRVSPANMFLANCRMGVTLGKRRVSERNELKSGLFQPVKRDKVKGKRTGKKLDTRGWVVKDGSKPEKSKDAKNNHSCSEGKDSAGYNAAANGES